MINEFPVVEIFSSLQGEGKNTGRKANFIRLGKCNLKCPWCDTLYNNFSIWTLDKILDSLDSSVNNVIVTGGEPTMHKNLNILVEALKIKKFNVWIETNGLLPIPDNIDYVAMSPKRMYMDLYKKNKNILINEVRVVVDDKDIFDFCEFIETRTKADEYYLSPCEIDGEMNIEETIQLLGNLNDRINKKQDWRLSIQSHKILGMR